MHAVDAHHAERRLADRLEHGLRVERLADALVERRERPRLLVVEPLGLQVLSALDREAELAAHRLEERELGGVEGGAGQRRHVQHAAARALERERHAGVRGRLLQALADHRHARALERVAGLPAAARGVHLAAQAFAEALALDESEVLRRDAPVRREPQPPARLVPQQHPGRPQAEACQQPLEGRIEDLLDVLLAVVAGRQVGQDGELALAPRHGLLERFEPIGRARVRFGSSRDDCSASLAPREEMVTQIHEKMAVSLRAGLSPPVARCLSRTCVCLRAARSSPRLDPPGTGPRRAVWTSPGVPGRSVGPVWLLARGGWLVRGLACGPWARQGERNGSVRYRFGPFVLAPALRQLFEGEREVPLIPRYFDLLLLLVERRSEASAAG